MWEPETTSRSARRRARALQSSLAEVIMFKKLLVFLGLQHAPTPVRTYLVASSAVGAVPAALFLAWKYRGRIAPMLRRATPQRSEQQVQPAT